ncbi:tagatose-6-phosphate kinase [Streptococcus danieliae]|nr:tagatose-6-phosphate kinase [Streptococcus acidominimus]MBF0838696.1 tagatose-6-phosphate kinase [Streptococcus acidominimus]MBF0846810.1 tagatose-6-phosphate kinase [Streptococcus danieliae]OLF49110.1 tagatose-6-phosphate kinase [Streptococcus acidominimus]TFU30309.1 tagatose-6-phosphate kinase [Streptococcus acidominimus]
MIHLVCPNPALDRTLLVERIEKNIPLRPSEVREYPGGKSFNVAYALKENGVSDYVIHTILGGRIGQYIQDLNMDKGNALQIVENSQNTRTCNIYMETETGDVTLFYEKGLDLTEDLLTQFTSQLEDSLSDGDWLVFSGSLMKGMPDDYIKQLIDRHPGVHTIVDTSGAALRAAYQSQPSLVKINNEELKDLYPDLDENSPEQILAILKEETPHENMIVTMGAKGSLAKIGHRFFRVAPLRVEALNPIASGDFYLGVLVKGLSQQEAPEIYLREAAAFSAANCLQYFPEVDQGEYQDLLEKVIVEEL